MKTLRYLPILLGIMICSEVMAIPVMSTANFTLRSATNAGPALGMDATWGNGGYEGFITNLENSQVDRTYLEFDMALFGGPVQDAMLDFTLDGSASDTISMAVYSANGIAELSDWFTPNTPFTTFDGGQSNYSIDITSLINSSLSSLAFIGFAFSIDSFPDQAFFDTRAAPVINYETASVPEPSVAILLSSSLMIFGLMRRRA